MQLVSFTVSNYRSITSAKQVALTNYSVMVGANNEGKSNILHALTLGMDIIESFKDVVVKDSLGRIRIARPGVLGRDSGYDWRRDFPIAQQSSTKKDLSTEILLEFSLTQEENESFLTEIGSKLNGTLPIQIKLSKSDTDLTIVKPGRGSNVLNRKTNKVADFISRNLSFEYIPAVRTSESSEEVLINLISKELSSLEIDKEYREAIDKIAKIQEPLLQKLSDSVTKTISSFLPSVVDVHIDMPQDARYRALRRGLRIVVDDGNRTPLERKGDGVKSLVALALMRYASDSATKSAHSIVAVEEPEAHLHPQAIHELRDVLLKLAEKSQVILTSHSPLFVNPAKLKSTIVVRDNKASVASNIEEVRDVLGVRLSDNLRSAFLVAIVEGDDDVIILKAILNDRYPELKEAIENGTIVFDALGGASNLSYKIRMYRSSATMVQCFLDDDEAGNAGVSKAKEAHLISIADYNQIIVSGQKEAELEDVLDPKKYKDAMLAEYNVDPTITPPTAKGKKWSVAMEKKFQSHGKKWDDSVEMKVKLWLAEYARDNISNILLDARMSPIDAFAKTLISKIRDV
jgi:AAA15 family ATPase/GTPase